MQTGKSRKPDSRSLTSPGNAAVIKIIKAWRQGRPLVLFLGSGTSVGSGFPTIQPLCAYLAHLQFAYHEGLYDHRFLGFERGVQGARDVAPNLLIEKFGWPTVEQLSHDMWRWLHKPDGNDTLFVNKWSSFVQAKGLFDGSLDELLHLAKLIPPRRWLVSIEHAVYLAAR